MDPAGPPPAAGAPDGLSLTGAAAGCAALAACGDLDWSTSEPRSVSGHQHQRQPLSGRSSRKKLCAAARARSAAMSAASASPGRPSSACAKGLASAPAAGAAPAPLAGPRCASAPALRGAPSGTSAACAVGGLPAGPDRASALLLHDCAGKAAALAAAGTWLAKHALFSAGPNLSCGGSPAQGARLSGTRGAACASLQGSAALDVASRLPPVGWRAAAGPSERVPGESEAALLQLSSAVRAALRWAAAWLPGPATPQAAPGCGWHACVRAWLAAAVSRHAFT